MTALKHRIKMANAEDRPFEYHIFQESNERLRAQKVSTKETDSNVVVRNLSVISTETLVCILNLY